MLLIASVAWSWDDAFSCPPVTTPAEVKASVEAAPDDAVDGLVEEVEALLDPAQVVACGGGGDTCSSANYSTADGASVDWRSVEDTDESSGGSSWSRVTTLRIDWPDGRWLEEQREDWGSSTSTGTSYSHASGATIELAWGGELDPEWPADQSLSRSTSSHSGDAAHGTAEYDERCAGECCWSSRVTEAPETSRACFGVGSDVACVDPFTTCGGDGDYGWIRPWASFRGDTWLQIDEDTWALTGKDSDGDHASDDVDCAPADPTVRPCRDDVIIDGIDQNCDGIDDAADTGCTSSGCATGPGIPWLAPLLAFLVRRARG